MSILSTATALLVKTQISYIHHDLCLVVGHKLSDLLIVISFPVLLEDVYCSTFDCELIP